MAMGMLGLHYYSLLDRRWYREKCRWQVKQVFSKTIRISPFCKRSTFRANNGLAKHLILHIFIASLAYMLRLFALNCIIFGKYRIYRVFSCNYTYGRVWWQHSSYGNVYVIHHVSIVDNRWYVYSVRKGRHEGYCTAAIVPMRKSTKQLATSPHVVGKLLRRIKFYLRNSYGSAWWHPALSPGCLFYSISASSREQQRLKIEHNL